MDKIIIIHEKTYERLWFLEHQLNLDASGLDKFSIELTNKPHLYNLVLNRNESINKKDTNGTYL